VIKFGLTLASIHVTEVNRLIGERKSKRGREMTVHSEIAEFNRPASLVMNEFTARLIPICQPHDSEIVPPVFTEETHSVLATEAGGASMQAVERERMLIEHLPTVRYLARRIHERLPQHVELEDLISAGMVGLIDAFTKFDHTKKVQFKSYAQFRIRGAILDSLRVLDWSPRELRRKGRAVQEAIQTLTHTLHRSPSEQEVAAEMHLPLMSYQQLLGDIKGLEIGSLHAERTEDSGDEELAYIAGSPEESPLFQCMQGEMKQHLIDAIEDLPEKERMVLTLYYYEELTMKEIGLTLGVVESRVSQIHTAAVTRMRSAMASLHGTKRPVARSSFSNGLAA
jgi:RNA polymerase sigma factor for flagellar operon FliA